MWLIKLLIKTGLFYLIFRKFTKYTRLSLQEFLDQYTDNETFKLYISYAFGDIGKWLMFKPYLTNGFSHYYHLSDSTFIFRGVRSDFYFFFYLIFDEISACKQNSPRWDAAFCGVTSWAMLFA